MKQNIISSLCFILLFISLVGCATSTKKLSLGYSVKPVSQLEKATAAYSRKDYPLAAELLEPLANEGDGYAQYALGYMYYNGLGVPRNQQRAHQLLNASASNGNKNAIEALRLIATVSGDSSSETTEAPDTNIAANTAMTSAPPSSEESVVSKVKVNKADEKLPEKNQSMEEPDLSTTADVPEETAMKMSTEQTPAEKPADDDFEKLAENESSLTKSEKWIVLQPDEYYTIQLLASGREAAMRQYIIDNDLQDSAIYYKSRTNSTDLFILVQGSFESFSEAKKTISLLPPEVQKAKPWVRSIGAIKESILTH